MITSGFQKKTQKTPSAEIARAERLRKLWLRYRNWYLEGRTKLEEIMKKEIL